MSHFKDSGAAPEDGSGSTVAEKCAPGCECLLVSVSVSVSSVDMSVMAEGREQRRWWDLNRLLPFSLWREAEAEEEEAAKEEEVVVVEKKKEEEEEEVVVVEEEEGPVERELTPTKYRVAVPEIAFSFVEGGAEARGRSEESDLSYASLSERKEAELPAPAPAPAEEEEEEEEEEEVVAEVEVARVALDLGAAPESLYEAVGVVEPVYASPVEEEAVVARLAPVYSSVVKPPPPPPPLPPPDWSPPPSSPSTPPPPSRLWRRRLRGIRRFCARVAAPRPSPLLSTLLLYQGQSGFDDLRRYIKQGGDFCKELAAILHERSEAEAQYAKTLGKLSGKLTKATREGAGTVNSAWQRVGVEMEAQSEIHRSFASSLSEEVVKPLRQLVESQHRIRKSVETAVDKSGKSLAEWRSAESKAKKNSFSCARDNEKLRDGGSEPRNRISASSLQLHRASADKEHAKLETKRRKAEECVKKADVEYYSVCMRAERARLEWESAVVRGGHCFQVLEEERLRGLKELAAAYLSGFSHIGPKLTEIGGRLGDPVGSCDVALDKETVASLRCQPPQEQSLPDFYAEHTNLAMNTDRRKQALVKLLQLIRQDVERERRGKNGVENLARALKQTPNFATEDTQHNVSEKLHHMRSMLAYLEATRYKVASALSEVEGRTRESHPLAEHIAVTRDRQGLHNSVLKVPGWVHKEVVEVSDYLDWVERGTADGNSVQPDSDFDEFSSQGSEREYETSAVVGTRAGESGLPHQEQHQRCKALYNYTANLYDELSLNPGDVINIHDKQPDGWWLGELNGVVGIFPATYVEEMK